jgi:hypothetical protein
MKRILVLACAAAVLIAHPRALFAQDHSEANSPKAEFQISKSLVVGTTTLPPGTYKFQCVFADGSHFLIVTGEDGKELARVPCKPEQLAGKIQLSDFRSITKPDGTQALTAVRIKGESVAHRLVLD